MVEHNAESWTQAGGDPNEYWNLARSADDSAGGDPTEFSNTELASRARAVVEGKKTAKPDPSLTRITEEHDLSDLGLTK